MATGAFVFAAFENMDGEVNIFWFVFSKQSLTAKNIYGKKLISYKIYIDNCPYVIHTTYKTLFKNRIIIFTIKKS